MTNGLGLPECGHGGVLKKTSITYHGTKNLQVALDIINACGVMADSVEEDRTLVRKQGWFHSQSFKQALTYARVELIGDVKCRVVLGFKCRCANRGNGDAALVTQHRCQRYVLSRLLIIPCSTLVPFLAVY